MLCVLENVYWLFYLYHEEAIRLWRMCSRIAWGIPCKFGSCPYLTLGTVISHGNFRLVIRKYKGTPCTSHVQMHVCHHNDSYIHRSWLQRHYQSVSGYIVAESWLFFLIIGTMFESKWLIEPQCMQGHINCLLRWIEIKTYLMRIYIFLKKIPLCNMTNFSDNGYLCHLFQAIVEHLCRYLGK